MHAAMPRPDVDTLSGTLLRLFAAECLIERFGYTRACSCHHGGVVKTYLPTSAFLHCSKATKPLNTLFHEIEDQGCVGFADLENYMDLVLALFSESPTGDLIAI